MSSSEEFSDDGQPNGDDSNFSNEDSLNDSEDDDGSGSDADEDDLFNYPEVMDAIEENDTGVMDCFVYKGLDVNMCNNSCIFYAISCGHVEMVEWFLENGAKLDCVNSSNIGPLNEAIHEIEDTTQRWQMVRFLINSGVNVKNDEHFERSYMHDAVYSEDVELVKFLFNAGAAVNRINSDGLAPIHLAISYLEGENRLEMIKQLIEIGANVNIKDDRGYTCLHRVAQEDLHRCKLTKMLIEAGAQLNCISDEGTTPLAVAAIVGDCEQMKLMIDAGADINFTKVLWVSPLGLAILNSRKDAVQLLCECGADLNIRDADRDIDVLTCAVFKLNESSDMSDYVEILQTIITYTAFNKRTEDEKFQMFEEVIKSGTVEAVKLFIENGIKLEKSRVIFPLCAAAFNIRVNVLEFLLKTYLFDVDEPNTDGGTPLMIAITTENTACVKLLLEWGADVKSEIIAKGVSEPVSPISQAAFKKNRAVLDLVMCWGAMPNPNGDDGYFAVMDVREPNEINNCLIAQSILLAGEEWSEIDPNYVWVRRIYPSKFVDECLAELEILKGHVLYGSVTLYDFLRGKDVTGFISNSHVIDKFESLNAVEKFPIYGEQIKVCHSMSCVKRGVMDEAVRGLKKLLDARFHQCHYILHNIMLYLHLKDLRNLSLV